MCFQIFAGVYSLEKCLLISLASLPTVYLRFPARFVSQSTDWVFVVFLMFNVLNSLQIVKIG